MDTDTYKLAHIDRAEILSAARKALIAADMHYYAWTVREQEHFLADCKLLMADYAEVEKLLAGEIDRANAWLAENHQDIRDSFDPAVVKLRKERKVIISPSALDDLSKIGEDDEPLST
ncbi:hypothetical protein FKG94_26040 [Exilibacterium tricleocarpae]|uniref:Uncharacterized protein n=1 Tax=Exilibacterium tricleocarpae TaxID=2591008 RepID=A0A545SQM0_9GAMM|nr:hypothetical protein [Exilibacterium tricleocarpae]TQV67257.1 hypothetical protein FKG94_26040 [Exilibacterium tricleocarpae]